MGGYTPTQVPDTAQCNDNVVWELWRVLGTAPTTDPKVGSNRDGYWGAPAYFSDSSGRQYVYYTGDYSPIKEFDLLNGSLTAGTVSGGNLNQTPSSEFNFPHGGTIPSISSNGGDPATAVLWAIRRARRPPTERGRSHSMRLRQRNLTNQLVFDVPAGSWNFHNDAFLIPTVVNGKVYVSSGGELDVFGIRGSRYLRLVRSG